MPYFSEIPMSLGILNHFNKYSDIRIILFMKQISLFNFNLSYQVTDVDLYLAELRDQTNWNPSGSGGGAKYLGKVYNNRFMLTYETGLSSARAFLFGTIDRERKVISVKLGMYKRIFIVPAIFSLFVLLTTVFQGDLKAALISIFISLFCFGFFFVIILCFCGINLEKTKKFSKHLLKSKYVVKKE
jgi:hypothetical protein